MTLAEEIDAMKLRTESLVDDGAIGRHYMCLDHRQHHELLDLLEKCKTALIDHENALKVSIKQTDEALDIADRLKAALASNELDAERYRSKREDAFMSHTMEQRHAASVLEFERAEFNKSYDAAIDRLGTARAGGES